MNASLAMSDEPAAANAFLADHVRLLCASYRRLIGADLLVADADPTLAEALYHAPFVVLSHGTDSDPIFNYANRTAQRLFEMTWAQITSLPAVAVFGRARESRRPRTAARNRLRARLHRRLSRCSRLFLWTSCHDRAGDGMEPDRCPGTPGRAGGDLRQVGNAVSICHSEASQ